MTEFGHVGIIGNGVCIDSWGAGPFVIDVKGKTFRFEDSDRFGPSFVNKRGDITDKQPGERSTFWRGHTLWVKQGRKVRDDGVTCDYEYSDPKPTTYRLVGREMFIVEEGDYDGELIKV